MHTHLGMRRSVITTDQLGNLILRSWGYIYFRRGASCLRLYPNGLRTADCRQLLMSKRNDKEGIIPMKRANSYCLQACSGK